MAKAPSVIAESIPAQHSALPDESTIESSPPDSDTALKEPNPRVLLLIVDGIRVEEISSTQPSDLTGHLGSDLMPGLWGTIGHAGTVLRQIYNTGGTYTFVAHAGLFAGRDLPLANLPVAGPNQSTLYRPEVLGLMQMAQERCGPARVHFVGDATLLTDSSGSLYPNYTSAGIYETLNAEMSTLDQNVVAAVKEAFSQNACLVVANLHGVDLQGHSGDAGGYLGQITSVDGQLSELWQWLQQEQSEALSETLVVVTGDHGRHRVFPTIPAWMEHGDACTGCREVPLFLVGPGIPAGEVREVSWTQADLSLLMAGWLGVELPYATGLWPDIGNLSGIERQGRTAVSVSDGLMAVQEWQADPEHRSRILVEGQPVSSPEAFAAEAPTFLHRDGQSTICWRELILDPEADEWPWQPRCLQRQDGQQEWQDIGFPTEIVGSSWEISLDTWEGKIWATWPETPWSDGGTDTDRLVLASYDGHSWTRITDYSFSFPVHPQILMASDGYRLLAGGSRDMNQARSDRQIQYIDPIYGWGIRSQNPVLSSVQQRVERATMAMIGEAIHFAAIGHDETGSYLLYSHSDNLGTSWYSTVALPSPAAILPHITPQWEGDRLYWAVQLTDHEAGICAMHPTESTATCISTQTPHLDALKVSQGRAYAAVDPEPLAWEIRAYTL